MLVRKWLRSWPDRPEWLKRLPKLKWKRRQELDEFGRLRQETKQAWCDYEAAHVYFNYVTDPELIDHSIYRLEASRKRFTYLWNRLRAMKAGERVAAE